MIEIQIQDMEKVVKVIKSCRTEEQFDVAENMIIAFLKKHESSDLDAYRMYDDLCEQWIEAKNNR